MSCMEQAGAVWSRLCQAVMCLCQAVMCQAVMCQAVRTTAALCQSFRNRFMCMPAYLCVSTHARAHTRTRTRARACTHTHTHTHTHQMSMHGWKGRGGMRYPAAHTGAR